MSRRYRGTPRRSPGPITRGGVRSLSDQPGPEAPASSPSDMDLKVRLFAVLSVFVLIGLVIVVKLVLIMIMPDPRLAERLQAQMERTVRLPARRAEVRDRNGQEMAVTVDVPSVFIDPVAVREEGGEDLPERLQELAGLLSLPPEEVLAQADRPGRFYWLRRRISRDLAARVQDLGIHGVALTDEPVRHYPGGRVGSVVLGSVSDGRGAEGVELTFDEVLTGQEEVYHVARDQRGRNITPDAVLQSRYTEGDEIWLTLDARIQESAENAIRAQVEAYEAEAGIALVMDVDNGDVLAMAQYPTFDANERRSASSAAARNWSVHHAYDPGSLIKLFTVAGALDMGVLEPDESFDCEMGAYRVPGKTIHDSHPHGMLDVGQIVQVSSNIGTVKIAERMGAEELWNFLDRLGFGHRTGIPLPGERRGTFRHWENWYPVDTANVSFGQGMSVTAVQLGAALASLGNGGWLPRPRLTAATRGRDGTLHPVGGPMMTRVMSEETADQLLEMMELVVHEDGTAPNVALPGYRLGGKTGTAQVWDTDLGSYNRNLWNASFFGLAPIDEPELAIVVTVVHPSRDRGYYGGSVAGPAFRSIAAEVLPYLGVEPSRPEELVEELAQVDEEPLPQPVEGPELMVLSAAGGPELAGVEGMELDPHHRDAHYRLPDLTGASAREVLASLVGIELDLRLLGQGRVVSQTPEPGTLVATHSQLTVQLAQP